MPLTTDAAKQWQGWGTALKPAYEPIVLARKPLSERTVAANVLTHGTGGLNVDGCRVATDETITATRTIALGSSSGGVYSAATVPGVYAQQPGGRWPANLCHDGSDEVLAEFPVTKSGSIAAHHVRTTSKTKSVYGERAAPPEIRDGDSGSAARFFYCAKASKADRNEGYDQLPIGVSDPYAEHRGRRMPEGSERFDGKPVSVGANTHPTVKPTDLMRWLCRLVTPPGGAVLDPFAGSGSTGKAAILEGFHFIGCEMTPEYAAIAHARLAYAAASF